MDCDSEPQRAFFHTSDFDKWGSRQSGLPQMELDWYDLVAILLETLRVDEVKEMGEIVRNGNTGPGSTLLETCHAVELKEDGEIVRKVNTGVWKHGIRATPRNKIGSYEEKLKSTQTCGCLTARQQRGVEGLV